MFGDNLKKVWNNRKFVDAENNRKSYGLLLWGLVLFGYFLFVFEWVMMNKLAGSVGGIGWMDSFFTVKPESTTTQAVNYSITAMRGLGSIGAGFVLAKVGHKYAVIIAMILLSFGLVGVWMPNYASFIVFRMIMAVGGTVLITYTQPIIARFFEPKEKTYLSRINSLGFNLGAAIPLILWCIPSVSKYLTTNWQVFSSIVAAIPLALLIFYFLFAKDIEIKKSAKFDNFVEGDDGLKKATWLNVGMDLDTWKYVLFFGGWLIAAVSVILVTPGSFKQLHNHNFDTPYQSWELLLPIVLFLLSFIPAIWLVGWISKTNIDRRYYIAGWTFFALVCITCAYLCTAYTKTCAGTSIFMFLAGLGIWGIQGPTLNLPHEQVTNSPQRVAIVIGFIWGAGYLMYTIANVIEAEVFDAFNVKASSSAGAISNAAWTEFGVFMLMALIMPIFALTMPKTKDIPITKIFKKESRAAGAVA